MTTYPNTNRVPHYVFLILRICIHNITVTRAQDVRACATQRSLVSRACRLRSAIQYNEGRMQSQSKNTGCDPSEEGLLVLQRSAYSCANLLVGRSLSTSFSNSVQRSQPAFPIKETSWSQESRTNSKLQTTNYN